MSDLEAAAGSVNRAGVEVWGNGCECWVTSGHMWTTYGDAVEPGSQIEYNPVCPMHGEEAPNG